MIHCHNLSKIYRSAQGEVKSLDKVDLEVQPGEFLSVRGPSGCGKTTLLLTLGGMLRPTRGQVTVDGQDLYSLNARERSEFRASRVGFIFQLFHLVPYLSVLDNILLAARPGHDEELQSRAETLLAELGLQHRLTHTPSELSAGERQRTAIARALLNQPKLILADEPTGNLDPDNATDVFRHLEQFNQSGGTVVVVTHGHVAAPYATRNIELKNGQVTRSSDAQAEEKENHK